MRSTGRWHDGTLRARVSPDKATDYIALIKTEMLPAVTKAGLKNYEVAQQRYGAPMEEFVSIYAEDTGARQDWPFVIAKAMVSGAWQQYLAKARSMLVEAEENFYALQPDLSYP